MASVPPPKPPSRAALVLQAISRAYFARERARLGIGAEQRADQEAASQDMLRKAQMARLLQQMGFEPEDRASELAHRDAQTKLYGAQEEAARALATQRETPKPTKMVERTVDLGNQIEYIYTDGSRELKPKGAAPKAPGEVNEGAVANPFNITDSKGNTRLAVRDKSVPGGIRFVDEIAGEKVSPGPTADMRNVEYQSQAVEPAFELVSKSLDSLEAASAGLGGSIKGAIPGTDAYFAKTRFIDQAKALLGAIVARQAGEGSRLSDEDRKAYSQAATIVNNLILLPGGIKEARERLNNARVLIADVIQRRRVGGDPGAPPADPAQTRVINGVTYVKVPGGWKRQ